MLGLRIVGRDDSTTVLGGAMHLWNNGPAIVGVLMLCQFLASKYPLNRICDPARDLTLH
jgi:hypothetical protein